MDLDVDQPWARRRDDGCSLTIRVEALRVRLAAPAVDGKANRELIRFLAGELGLPTRAVEIASGHTSRTKVVRVHPAP